MVYKSAEDVKRAIKAAAAERGITISALADTMGVPQPNMSRTINRLNPSFNTVRDIADALGCDLVFEILPRAQK